MSAVDVVDRQITAYNVHDLDAFTACYATDVTIRSGLGATVMEGREAVRTQYGTWFTQHPDLHVEVRERMCSGNWVVDREHVTMSDGAMEGAVAYHVTGELIDAVVMLLDP